MCVSPDSVVGLTHASSVSSFEVIFSELESAASAKPVPLNKRALPVFPDDHDGPESDSVFPLPEESAATEPEPSSSEYAAALEPELGGGAGGGGGRDETVTIADWLAEPFAPLHVSV